MRPVPNHLATVAVALSAILSVAPLMTGCSDVPEHPGQWEEGTSPLGDKPGQGRNNGTSGNGSNKSQDSGKTNPSGDGGKADRTDGTSDSTTKVPVPTEVTADGIWVRTEVTTTLTDKDGEEMVSYYENVLDDHGNVEVTTVESDDWEGRISYEFDGDGYRTFCDIEGDDDLWIPEFECGFLSMVCDERTPCSNVMGSDGLLAKSVMGEDADTTATYSYDADGRLRKLATSDGRVEEYDEHGNIVRISEIDPDDPSYTEIIAYDYRYALTDAPKSAALTYVEVDGNDTDREPFGNITYETDGNGNVTKATVTDVEDEFGYVLVVECEYEYIATPSKGARLYAQMDRFGTFF